MALVIVDMSQLKFQVKGILQRHGSSFRTQTKPYRLQSIRLDTVYVHSRTSLIIHRRMEGLEGLHCSARVHGIQVLSCRNTPIWLNRGMRNRPRVNMTRSRTCDAFACIRDELLGEICNKEMTAYGQVFSTTGEVSAGGARGVASPCLCWYSFERNRRESDENSKNDHDRVWEGLRDV